MTQALPSPEDRQVNAQFRRYWRCFVRKPIREGWPKQRPPRLYQRTLSDSPACFCQIVSAWARLALSRLKMKRDAAAQAVVGDDLQRRVIDRHRKIDI